MNPLPWDNMDWGILDRLRDGFLQGVTAGVPYWESQYDLAHYDATFGERIGWKWDHVLAELKRRGWSPPPGPLLDWGCGSGIAGRRVLQTWPDWANDPATELQLFDHSLNAESFAAARARSSFPELAVHSWDRAVRPTTLVISHVLNELDADATADLEEVIAAADVVLWLEPGTSAVARELVKWRERLQGRFRVIYPCPHQGPCGMLTPGNERHWCHHFAAPPSAIFADSNWVRFGQRAGIDLRSLPYSALVLDSSGRSDPDPLPADAARAIGRPQVFKPYARILGCDAQGVRSLELAKRIDARLIKRLDRADAPHLFAWNDEQGQIEHLRVLFPPPS